jgi:hypothetical protein
MEVLVFAATNQTLARRTTKKKKRHGAQTHKSFWFFKKSN